MTDRYTGAYKITYLKPTEKVNRWAWLVPPEGTIKPEQGVLYVSDWKEDGKLQRVYFLCPCNRCQTTVELNLEPDFNPNWSFKDVGGLADISPSIHRVGDQDCHFFIKPSGVQWC